MPSEVMYQEHGRYTQAAIRGWTNGFFGIYVYLSEMFQELVASVEVSLTKDYGAFFPGEVLVLFHVAR